MVVDIEDGLEEGEGTQNKSIVNQLCLFLCDPMPSDIGPPRGKGFQVPRLTVAMILEGRQSFQDDK